MTEFAPIVVVPACDVPDGKMPQTAAAMVRRALALGCVVRSTYAVAFDPGVLRAGERVTLTLETIVVRFRHAGAGWAAYACWACESAGGAWRFDSAWIREPGQWPRRVNTNGVYV